MAYSIIQTTASGSTNTFTIDFTLGFNNRNEVTCQVNNEVDGLGDPVYRTLTWINDGLVTVDGALLTAGWPVVFKRTVTKTALIHDYSNGEAIEESNLDESNKQTLMAVHEVLDGRFGSPFQDDLDMGTHKIVNLAAGVASTDAVNKAQLDAVEAIASETADEAAAAHADRLLCDADVVLTHADVVLTHADVVTTGNNVTAAQNAQTAAEAAANGMKWRPPVRTITTANITLSGAQTINGVSIVALDRVLVANQSTTSQNGVYIAAAGAWSRATDADTWNEIVGQVVIAEEGTDTTWTKDTAYVCTVDPGGTLGSTAVAWAKLPTAISSGQVVNSMLADMADTTVKGRAVGAGTGAPVDLSAAQITAILTAFAGDSGSGSLKGLVPAAAAGDAAASKFLKANGVWTALPGLQVKVGTLTYNIATASGNTVVTGVGFQPKAILAMAVVGASSQCSIIGFTDGTSQGCITDSGYAVANTEDQNNSLFYIISAVGSYVIGSVTTFGSDGFTINWTKTGTPTGTARIYYLCIA